MLLERNEIKLIGLFKVCTKCEDRKSFKEFAKHLSCRFGIASICKKCSNIHDKTYRENNKKELKLYRVANKEKKDNYCKTYYRNNTEKRKLYSKIYRKNNKEKIKAVQKAYRKNNKEKQKSYRKAYYENNKEYHRIYTATYQRNRRRIDAKFKLNANVSTAIYKSLKGNKNGYHWENLVGYTLDRLKKHLEKLFIEGMSWKNYGKWDIDHKIPKIAFNFTEPDHEDFKRCWALSNLQPMWGSDNNKKRAKLIKHFQPSLLI